MHEIRSISVPILRMHDEARKYHAVACKRLILKLKLNFRGFNTLG